MKNNVYTRADSLHDGDEVAIVALRGSGSVSFKFGRSKYMPEGDMPCFRRAAPEKSVPLSIGSLVATSIYSRTINIKGSTHKGILVTAFPR
jgi:hypothetical protein